MKTKKLFLSYVGKDTMQSVYQQAVSCDNLGIGFLGLIYDIAVTRGLWQQLGTFWRSFLLVFHHSLYSALVGNWEDRFMFS